MIKGYVTTNEAAERLGVSSGRIRQMIIQGIIKDTTKAGQVNLIPEKEVKRLESTERAPGRPAASEKSKTKTKKS